MHEISDIRSRRTVSGREILALNFIRALPPYLFRRHHRSGLRSLIFEVLSPEAAEKETRGVITDGIRLFPRAIPIKMFRIFKTRFRSKADVFREIEKYRILLGCLGPSFIARSDEFIVDYRVSGKTEILLCGLQEYVDGEILDPWRIHGENTLKAIFSALEPPGPALTEWCETVKNNTTEFVHRIRQMIRQTGHIPDLAGVGNLILTRRGGLKLVDINNIVQVNWNAAILIDDRGYPACDVSVEVLRLLEQSLLGLKPPPDDPLYRHFLAPDRTRQVRALEKAFYCQRNNPCRG